MKNIILSTVMVMLSIQLSGQFKEISGTFNGQSTQSGPINLGQIPVLPIVEDDRYYDATFHANAIPEANLLLMNNKAITKINTADNGQIIAMEVKLDFSGRTNGSPVEKAKFALSQLSQPLGFLDNVHQFEILNNSIDEIGNTHVKFQHLYKGIPVYGKELILHGKDGDVNFVNGQFEPVNDADIIPTVSLESSQSSVIGHLGSIYNKDIDRLGVFDIEPLTSKLVIYEHEGVAVLAYHHVIYSDLIHRWEYIIGAKDGQIYKSFENICKFHHGVGQVCDHSHSDDVVSDLEESTVNTVSPLLMDGPFKATAPDLLNQSREIDTYLVGSTYYLIDGSRPMFQTNSSMPNDPEGTIWTIDALNTNPQKDNFNYDHVKSNNNNWGNKTSVSSHFNGAKAYLYFRNIHNRNSINGSGGNIVSLINVADEDGQSMGNAFWNGAAMFYGNGDASFKPLAAGLDVAGHEMCHGVVQNTANLEYLGESGALNESFADVFGAMIDRDDWLIGEDVVKTSAFPSGALRSLIDPHNGAAVGNYGDGWQPKKYSERYTGSQDNGGVHINSGIPNHAFYLFATDARLGSTENERKIKAEKVYYSALSNYMTKSSKFVDCRIAVTRAAKELYGTSVESAAAQAFDKVEIGAGSGGTYQNDANQNPGADLILFTSSDQDNLFIYTPAGQEIANPLSQSNPISKPSVTDKGNIIVFVDDKKDIRLITIDWAAGNAEEQLLNTNNAKWRNVAVSKDGKRLAALRDEVENKIVVFDLTNGNGVEYELKNPTFTTGVSTGDVLFADAMEFDYTNEYLMYDAKNRIKSNTAGNIEYWDVGFIKVWNKQGNTFALPDQISKLFQGLPEGVSIGNPTFSKNSNYIIAFDLIEDSDYSLLGANVETGALNLIFDNEELGYPSYSKVDDKVIFDYVQGNSIDLGIQGVETSKIQGKGDATLFTEDSRWAVWFSNGVRNYTSVPEIIVNGIAVSLTPNPASQHVTVSFEASKSESSSFKVIDALGKVVKTLSTDIQNGHNQMLIDMSLLPTGTYFLHGKVDGSIVYEKIVKL